MNKVEIDFERNSKELDEFTNELEEAVASEIYFYRYKKSFMYGVVSGPDYLTQTAVNFGWKLNSFNVLDSMAIPGLIEWHYLFEYEDHKGK